MDIAKKNDSHIEKYNIEVLHKGTTSNVIIRIKFINCLQDLQYLRIIYILTPHIWGMKFTTRSLCCCVLNLGT